MAPSLIPIDETFLPLGQFRLVNRVAELEGERIVCEIDVGPGHWVYPVHFPGDPIFPGAFIIESAAQTALLWAWAQGLRGRPRMAKTSAEFHATVTPADGTLIARATVKRKRFLNFASVEFYGAGGDHKATVAMVVGVVQTT